MSSRSVAMVDELGRKLVVSVSGASDGFLLTGYDEFGRRTTGAYMTREHAKLLQLFLNEHLRDDK